MFQGGGAVKYPFSQCSGVILYCIMLYYNVILYYNIIITLFYIIKLLLKQEFY